MELNPVWRLVKVQIRQNKPKKCVYINWEGKRIQITSLFCDKCCITYSTAYLPNSTVMHLNQSLPTDLRLYEQ